MKNQYFGDVGDFGKYGLLTALSSGPLKLGVNWYLTMDDTKPDGKYTEYLYKNEFMVCDKELHSFLNNCIKENRRNVDEIKKLGRFDNVLFYDEILNVEGISALSEAGRRARKKKREDWFNLSLNKLSGCDIIFCDPDNGIETKSLSKTGKDSVKYIYINEINHMLKNGSSLVIYNHRDRSTDFEYKERFRKIYQNVPDGIKMRIIRFNRFSVRDYIVLMQHEHIETIENQLDEFLGCELWRKHFREIEILNRAN